MSPRSLLLLALTCAVLLRTAWSAGSDPPRRAFDLAGGDAAVTLRQFARQSGEHLIFPVAEVRGVKTNPVAGRLAPREALDRMLHNTGLVALRDEQTGALAVRRVAPTPAPPSPSPVRKPSAATDPPVMKPRLLPFLAWMTASAAAQTNPETVTLSAFEVQATQAIGYRSLESISGSNTRIAIRDLPQSISVINAEFVQDIGASTLAESVAYSAALTSGRNVQQFNRVEFSLRGFPATTLREGLTWTLGNDSYNIDRIEVVKGPAAVLYGASQPGGFVNVMSKRPRATFGGSAKVTLGRYDRQRAELDVTGPLAQNKTVLFRVAGAFERFDTFREFENGENAYVNPMLTWKPWQRLSFTVGHEFQKMQRTPNNQTPILYPSSAGPTALNNAATPPAAWQAIGWAEVPRSWNDVGPYSFEDMEVGVTNTDLQLELASWLSVRNRLQFLDLDRTELRRTGNRINLYANAAAFRNGTPNAAGIPTPNTTVIGNGGQFKTTNYTPERRESFVAKTEFVFKLARERVAENTLLTGIERTDAYIDQVTYRIPAAVHPNYTFDVVNASNQPFDQYYQIHPGPNFSRFDSSLFTQVLSTNRNRSKSEAYYFVDHLALWERRLHVSAGIRFRELGDWDDAGTVPQYGIVYQPTRQISLFALRNDSYVLNSPTSTQASPPPQTGKNQEVGAKLEFLDGRLGVTASWFRVQREGIGRLIATATTGVFETQYSGLEQSDGFEVESYYAVTPDWNLYGGYTYADARVMAGDASPAANSVLVGTPVQSAPLHKGTLWQRYRFAQGRLKGFSIGSGVIAASESQAYAQADRLNLKNDAYVRVDASLGYERTLGGRPMRFQLNLINLTDEAYRDVQGGLASSFSWRFSTEVRF